MSLSKSAKPTRRAVLIGIGAMAGTAVLAACGFSPAYGPNGVGTRLRNQIVADAPDNRAEYAFVAQLEDRLGRNLSAPYALRYALSTSEDGVAITADQVTQRYHIAGQLTYSVVEQATQTVLTRGTLSNFTAYSTTGSTVSTRAAEVDAEERLARALADEMVTRLLGTADRWLP
ncbi:MAG: LPS assembly lipoprotein LptE [Celeribacter sp.]